MKKAVKIIMLGLALALVLPTAPAKAQIFDQGDFVLNLGLGIGSSYYTGVSNIFRYDLDLDSMDAISNAETGFFKPLPVWEDSLIVFSYTGKGFLPSVMAEETLEDVSATRYLGTMIAREYPVVRDWISDSPSSIEIRQYIAGSNGLNGGEALNLSGYSEVYFEVEIWKLD